MSQNIEEAKKPVVYFGSKSDPERSRKAYEVGEVISGVFKGAHRKPGMGGKEMVTFYIEGDNEVFGLNALGDLEEIIQDSSLKEGDEISVEMIGHRKTKSGYMFRNFSITYS